ncbi:MAG: hypothetical protein N2C12_08380, partial [Planctomycetales bacterium]
LIIALVASLGNGLFDPVTDRIGRLVLTSEPLQPVWAFLYQLPLMAWTGFDNTVVMGGILFSTAFFFPVYWALRPVFETRLNTTDKLDARATPACSVCSENSQQLTVPAHDIVTR